MNGIHEVTGSIPVWSTNFISVSGSPQSTTRSRLLMKMTALSLCAPLERDAWQDGPLLAGEEDAVYSSLKDVRRNNI
jgi:hypothetical protein